METKLDDQGREIINKQAFVALQVIFEGPVVVTTIEKFMSHEDREKTLRVKVIEG